MSKKVRLPFRLRTFPLNTAWLLIRVKAEVTHKALLNLETWAYLIYTACHATSVSKRTYFNLFVAIDERQLDANNCERGTILRSNPSKHCLLSLMLYYFSQSTLNICYNQFISSKFSYQVRIIFPMYVC